MTNTIVVDGNTQLISGILGSTSSSDLLKRINRKFQKHINVNNFKTVEHAIKKGRQILLDKIIKPQMNLKGIIDKAMRASKMKKEDNVYKPLITEDDLKNIPPIMFESILTYKPVRELHRDERIYGFGIDPKSVNPFDPYTRLIYNGISRNLIDDRFKDHEVRCISVWKDTDPDLTWDEIDAIEWTRIKIDELIEKRIDPTDYPNNIG